MAELIWFREPPQSDGYYLCFIPVEGEGRPSDHGYHSYIPRHNFTSGYVETVADPRNADYWLKDGGWWKCNDGVIRKWTTMSPCFGEFRRRFKTPPEYGARKKPLAPMWFARINDLPPHEETTHAKSSKTKRPNRHHHKRKQS